MRTILPSCSTLHSNSTLEVIIICVWKNYDDDGDNGDNGDDGAPPVLLPQPDILLTQSWSVDPARGQGLHHQWSSKWSQLKKWLKMIISIESKANHDKVRDHSNAKVSNQRLFKFWIDSNVCKLCIGSHGKRRVALWKSSISSNLTKFWHLWHRRQQRYLWKVLRSHYSPGRDNIHL